MEIEYEKTRTRQNDDRKNISMPSAAYLEVFAREQLDPHDGEDEPEYQADQQDVEDAWNGLDKGIHDHLTWQGVFSSGAGRLLILNLAVKSRK
jgi:hypothetical protein